MVNNRIVFTSGSASLLLVAVAVAPIIIKKCKPAVKAVGASLVKAGNAVQKLAETPIASA